jgi:GTPase SAR1 family protein
MVAEENQLDFSDWRVEDDEPRERAIAFARRHGKAHVRLAFYAALPLGLTSDLVHLLRVNFVPEAPWVAEADLLLSPLCREAGGSYYEMDDEVRELLLDEFIFDADFGPTRLKRAARFLHRYSTLTLKTPSHRDAYAFWRTQQLAALAYLRPEEAARSLATELKQEVDTADRGEALRIARLTNLLAAPLAEHDELVLYAAGVESLVHGDNAERTFDLFDASGANQGALNVLGVTLPPTPDLAGRLGFRVPRVKSVEKPTRQKRPKVTAPSPSSYPPVGITLRKMLPGVHGMVTRLAWSPNGKYLACPTSGSTISLWDMVTSNLKEVVECGGAVRQVAFSPDRQSLAAVWGATLRVWSFSRDLLEAFHDWVFEGDQLSCFAWSNDSETLAIGGREGVIHFVPPARSEKRIKTVWAGRASQPRRINALVWIGGTPVVAFAAADGAVGLCEEDRLVEELTRHEKSLVSIAFNADHRLLASGAGDGAITIWSAANWSLQWKLEGHTKSVTSLAYTSDGRILASKSLDGTVKLWRTDTWETVVVLDEPVPRSSKEPGIAFHPTSPILATIDKTGSGVSVWDVDIDRLYEKPEPEKTIYYRNAKVLLIGNPGVGKTALANRLVKKTFEEAQTIPIGEKVSRLLHERVPAADGRDEVREALLWDLPGRMGAYRFGRTDTQRLSQLLVNNASVALFVVNRDHGPLPEQVNSMDSELEAARLAEASSAAPVTLKKIIVESRSDISGISRGRNGDDALLRERGFTGPIRTSAKTDEGIDQLLKAIREAISWPNLPVVLTTEPFQNVTELLLLEKQTGRKLTTIDELYERLPSFVDPATSRMPNRIEFETLLATAEQFDLIQHLDFSGLVLLQPDELSKASLEILSEAGSDERARIYDERL